jgi:hypothetical protein
MIDGWRAEGDTGAALAPVIVKPALMATAAASESKTLRMDFSLGFSIGELIAEQPGKFQDGCRPSNYISLPELPVGGLFTAHSCCRSWLRSRKIGGPSAKEDPPQNQSLRRTHHTAALGLVTMTAVVMMPVVVMMMVVAVTTDPHAVAVGIARPPVVMAALDPADIVHHVRADNRRPHRRRSDDRRAGVRRRQHCCAHGHRCGSQAQKQVTHL